MTSLRELGVTLFEMVAGSLPFSATSTDGLLAARLLDDPPDVRERAPGVSPSFAEIVKKVMSKEPALRYPSGLVPRGATPKVMVAPTHGGQPMNVNLAHLFFITAVGTALGCGPIELEDPAAPTGSQNAASEALAEVGARAALAASGDIEAAALLEIHDLLATLSDTAIIEGFETLPTDGRVTLLDPSCATGDTRGGFTFDGCPVPGGELVGQILVEGVGFELRVPPPPAGLTTSMIEGELLFADGHLTGELSFRTGDDGVEDPSCACTVGGDGAHVRTRTIWDVQVDPTRRCLTNGTVEVQVVAFGGEDSARFEFGECGVVAVRNEVD